MPDRPDVGANRRIADAKLLSDPARADAVRHELEHLALSRAQALSHVLRFMALAHQPGDHRRGDQAHPTPDLANRRDDLRRGARLVEVGACTCFDGGEAGAVAVVTAQEHEPGVRKGMAHRNRRVAACAVVEMEVHHDDIRRQLPGQRGGFGNRGRAADHLHVLLAVQQQTQALRDELVVFDDHDPGCVPVGRDTRNWRQAPDLQLPHGRGLRTARLPGLARRRERGGAAP